MKTLERENKTLKGALSQAKLRETNLNSTLNNINKVNKDLNSISHSLTEKLNNRQHSKDNELMSGLSRDSLSRSQPSQHKHTHTHNANEHSISNKVKYKHTQPPVTKWLNYTSIPEPDTKSKILNNSYSRDEYNMIDQYIDDSQINHISNIKDNVNHKYN